MLDNSLCGPKSSQELGVCEDHRPFSRRYWVVDGDGTIAPGEFLKSQVEFADIVMEVLLPDINELRIVLTDGSFVDI